MSREGGRRQRLDAVGSALPVASDSLAKWLLQEWSWGNLTPQQIQKISALAVADMRAAMAVSKLPEKLVGLSTLGGELARANNMNRDLQNRIGCITVQLDSFSMFLKGCAGEEQQQMLLPHVLFSHMYHQRRVFWSEKVCKKDLQEEFWRQVPRDNHPVWERDLSMAIPISIYGDGVPVVGTGKAWSKSLDILCWSSLVGNGTTVETKYVAWTCFQHLQDATIGRRIAAYQTL
eukprot:6491728-Amphidinium_carterae.1